MNLVFLCGSLEPGRDGVGDYTRRLAGSLCQQGHRVTMVALNDRFTKKTTEQEQEYEGHSLPVLRIKSTESNNERLQQIQRWVVAHNPEWISLQFVPFSFQKKGLPIHLKQLLMKIAEGRKLHIMFHELWVVRDLRISLKSWLLGTLQKIIILNLIKETRPRIIHTQTQLYLHYLITNGVSASHLPLFSNIPIQVHLPKMDFQPEKAKRRKIVCVVFGSIYPNSLFKDFAKEVKNYADLEAVGVSLVIVGRSGPALSLWKAIWLSMGLEIETMGEQSSEKISEALLNASVGLTTTPYPLVEKSGAVAAMLEHGLPVLCLASPWKPVGLKEDFLVTGVSQYRQGCLNHFLSQIKQQVNKSGASEVSEMFIEALIDSQEDNNR